MELIPFYSLLMLIAPITMPLWSKYFLGGHFPPHGPLQPCWTCPTCCRSPKCSCWGASITQIPPKPPAHTGAPSLGLHNCGICEVGTRDTPGPSFTFYMPLSHHLRSPFSPETWRCWLESDHIIPVLWVLSISGPSVFWSQ